MGHHKGLRYAVFMAAVLSLGCRPISMATLERVLSGQVDLTALGQGRTTQATISEVANAATVSLIDVGLNKTIGTSVTDSLGRFNLNFGNNFKPSTSASYYLEAVKGLSSNKAGSKAARVRTLIRWQSGGWVSLTNAIPGSGLVVCRGTTAVATIVSHRSGTAYAVDVPNLMGKVEYNISDASIDPPTSDTFNGTKDYPNLTNAEFHGVWGMTDKALTNDEDPIAAVAYDPSTNLFSLSTSDPPVLAAAPSGGASVGDVVTLSGITFDATAANNIVKFNGVQATVDAVTPDRLSLTCKIPNGATTGPLTVTISGQTVGLPSYTVLSTANITISAFR